MNDTRVADHPHLLVVDDDIRLRELLQRYLSGNGFRVTTAANTAEAENLLGNLTFDALILDVMLPGESGFAFASRLRTNSEIPILILTARGGPEDRIAGLERGVDDYLGKPFEPRELELRLNALLRRSQPQRPHALKEVYLGSCVFDVERGELRRAGNPVKLTTAELHLLRLFASHAGRPFSRETLCLKLNIVLERSIDVQVTRLRRKIEENPKIPLYLQTVRGVGYVLVPDHVA